VKILGKPWLLLLPVLAFVWGVWFFGLTRTLDRAFFDHSTVITASSLHAPTNGVMVLIDEASLGEISKRYSVGWPWPRPLFAALIASLHQAGAGKVLMDFEFFEQKDQLGDDMLAAYAAACRETVLGRSLIKNPIFWSDDFTKSYPQFAVQSRLGLVDFAADGDGVYRVYPMKGSLAAQATTNIPAEPTSLLRWYGGVLYAGHTNTTLLPTNVVLSATPFVILGTKIQADLRAQKIDETDPASLARGLPTLSPLDESIASLVRGKVVFVGANASGTVDMKATPVSSDPEPGLLVHYTAWANAEQNCFIRQFPPYANLLISVLLAFAVIFVGWRHPSVKWLAGFGALLMVLLFAGSYFAFRAGTFFAPTTAAFGIFFALLASSIYNFWRESARKREIQGIFGSYVSKQVVETLLKNPEAIQLGGEKKELAVFFSDLVGFTTFSEKLTPEKLVQLINWYLGEMTNFILDNGGFVDKYIGDAIMGVFGSPEKLENPSLSACRAAIACRDHLAKMNANPPIQTDVKLAAAIGINTGDMVVGNVGSERKKNYTVLGDAVNLASRLEAANRGFGTTILIGENTERHVRGLLVTRPIALLTVKGKTLPVQTYEVIGELDKVAGPEKQFIAAYSEGYAAYLKREFAAAKEHFLHAKARKPTDRMTQSYLDNLAEFEHQPPPPDWNGVLILKSK
jgi:adenylate cyclase